MIMSEILAFLAFILKVLEYLSTVLDSKWITLPVTSLLNYLSAILLFLSIFLWLYSSNKRLEKVDAIAEEMKKINKLEWIAKYGFIGVLVSDLINLDKVRAHNIAGFQTISPIFSKLIPQSARDFYNLETGEQDQIQLRELHIVDTFLFNLINALPSGSVWMGISRLQSPEAWEEKSATIDFYNFHETVKKRSNLQEIKALRLYLFEDKKHMEDMSCVMNELHQNKLAVRYLLESGFSSDISLVWVPIDSDNKTNHLLDVNPIELLEGNSTTHQPLCAIKFVTRGGMELDEMNIYSAGVTFDQFALNFKKEWNKADSIIYC